MKVLVTGGAGYIGTELTYKLVGRDDVDEILVYDNLSRPNYNLFIIPERVPLTKVRFVRGDILDSRKLRTVLREVDVVYHLAARVTTPYSDESAHLYEQVNHWGTAELVSAVEESGVSRFIFTSSASVYGFSEAVVTTDTPPHPKTYYGAAKLRAEDQVDRLRRKLRTYTIRCANVYGYSKSMRFDAVINRFMLSALIGEPMIIQGSGTQVRSFVNISTVAQCLVSLLTSELPGSTYNLVDRASSIIELTDVIRLIYPEAEILYVSQHVEPRHLRVDVKDSMSKYVNVQPGRLAEELRDFLRDFALVPHHEM